MTCGIALSYGLALRAASGHRLAASLRATLYVCHYIMSLQAYRGNFLGCNLQSRYSCWRPPSCGLAPSYGLALRAASPSHSVLTFSSHSASSLSSLAPLTPFTDERRPCWKGSGEKELCIDDKEPHIVETKQCFDEKEPCVDETKPFWRGVDEKEPCVDEKKPSSSGMPKHLGTW